MVLKKKKKDEAVEENDGASLAEGIAIKKPGVKKSEALWLMTFSDLSFVLLCFFVLLISFSEPKKDKMDAVATGMSNIQVKDPKDGPNLEYMSKAIKKEIKKQKLDKVADVKIDSKGLAIEFKNAALFASGSARPNPKYRKVVGKVLKAIAKAPKRYKIKIEGHTDDAKMRGGRFRSNWDLASARGVAVLNQLKRQKLPEKRMAVVAYAHTRPKVKYKGKKGPALKKARAANRRVVIRIE